MTPPYTTTQLPDDFDKVNQNPMIGNSARSEGIKTQEKGQNGDPTAARHGDHPNPRNLGHDFQIGELCERCPLKYATLERDMIQYKIYDPHIRNVLEMIACYHGWKIERKTRDTWIDCGAMKLQLGKKTVVIYHDDPKDFTKIGEWFRKYFSPVYPNVEAIIQKVKNPLLVSRDELTLEIIDEATKKAILGIIQPYKNQQGYLFWKSPNDITPPLKIYEQKETGNLRIEFDARDDFKILSAIAMQRRLETIIPYLSEKPGKFFEFLQDFYSPALNNSVLSQIIKKIHDLMTLFQEMINDVSLGLLELNTQIKEMTCKFTDVKNRGDTSGLNHLIDAFFSCYQGDLKDTTSIILALSNDFGITREDATTFLAAFAVWNSKMFKGQVLREEIYEFVSSNYPSFNISPEDISKSIATLNRIGFLEYHPEYEVYFSKPGIRLCKKLVPYWRMR